MQVSVSTRQYHICAQHLEVSDTEYRFFILLPALALPTAWRGWKRGRGRGRGLVACAATATGRTDLLPAALHPNSHQLLVKSQSKFKLD